MEFNGVADTVANIRQYWGLNHGHTDEELFANAHRQWERLRRSDDAARDLVLQVVACGLEEQLLLWLLQHHADDAAEDIQAMVSVCLDPYFNTDGLELVKPMLDALLLAACLRAAASDRNVEDRKKRMAEILDMMKGRAFANTKTKYGLSALYKSETAEEDDDAWMQFLGLSNVLDPRVFNSRSGRDFMDAAEQIISLQQAELASVRGSAGRVELDGDYQEPTIVFWSIATQIVGLMKTEASSSGDGEVVATSALNSSLSFVGGADFEEYLKAKALSCAINDSSDHAIDFVDDDMELAVIEQLVSVWSSSRDESLVSADLLESVFDELSSLKNLATISIQTSFLLGMQMRSKRCFVDHCDSMRDEYDRRIKRIFNRLTDNARELEHVESLVVLAAFRPGQVIQQCVRGARTGSSHHSLYSKVLCASPLLLDWKGQALEEAGTLLMRELRQTLLDISSDQRCFDRESQNVLSFLLSLIGIDGDSASKRDTLAVTMTDVLDGVINPVCCRPDQSLKVQLNLLTLVEQLLRHVAIVDGGVDINSGVLKDASDLVLEAICASDTDVCDLRLAVLVRERLLLLLKSRLELMSDPVSMVTLDKVTIPLSASLWTLVSLFDSDFGDGELCKGLNDVAAVEVYMQEESKAGLSLPSVISAIQALLWGLLWDSTLAESESVGSTKPETWRLLDAIAVHDFSEDSSVNAIKGDVLIQSAIAEMMLECGSALFQVMLFNIIPYLLEYEPVEISEEEKLTIPKWAAGVLPEQPDFELQIPCQLVSTHSLMRYVAKSWGLSGAATKQLATPSNVLLVESLSHVLTVLDQAVTSSQRSMSGSLFCIQRLCFLSSTATEMHLETLPTWPTVRTQVELSLLRLLHQLEQLREISTTEAYFSQNFVAAWLAYLPAGQFNQVFNFIATRHR